MHTLKLKIQTEPVLKPNDSFYAFFTITHTHRGTGRVIYFASPCDFCA